MNVLSLMNLAMSAITISGSGFSTSTNNTVVTVQGQNFPVDTASESTITCSIPPQTPAGFFPVQVTITDKGKATLAPGTSCDFSSDFKPITDVNPSSCGLGGKYPINHHHACTIWVFFGTADPSLSF